MAGRHWWLRYRANRGELIGQSSDATRRQAKSLLMNLLVQLIFFPLVIVMLVLVLSMGSRSRGVTTSVTAVGHGTSRAVALNPGVFSAGFGQSAGLPIAVRVDGASEWRFVPVFGLEKLRGFESDLDGGDTHIMVTSHRATGCVVRLEHPESGKVADFHDDHLLHVPHSRFGLHLGR